MVIFCHHSTTVGVNVILFVLKLMQIINVSHQKQCFGNTKQSTNIAVNSFQWNCIRINKSSTGTAKKFHSSPIVLTGVSFSWTFCYCHSCIAVMLTLLVSLFFFIRSVPDKIFTGIFSPSLNVWELSPDILYSSFVILDWFSGQLLLIKLASIW